MLTFTLCGFSLTLPMEGHPVLSRGAGLASTQNSSCTLAVCDLGRVSTENMTSAFSLMEWRSKGVWPLVPALATLNGWLRSQEVSLMYSLPRVLLTLRQLSFTWAKFRRLKLLSNQV